MLSGYNPRGASEATPKAAARAGFGGRFTRDFALANKGGDNLNPRFGIAPNWHSTLVGQVVAAKYPAPEPVPLREPRESGTEGDLEKVARDSDARRYPEPRPAIIQPYDATQSPPNWGADEARVVGQGPQDPVHPELHTNLWLEDIHAWDQATFDQPQYYGLKAPIEESGTSTSGGASSA